MVLEDGYLIVEPIQRLVAAARAHKIPIVWICQKYRMDKYDKVTEKRVGTCYEGTWGAEQIDELPILPEDYVVNKRRYSGFFQTDLDLTLRDMGCEKVIVGGAVTNICVRGTVADAFQLDYEVVRAEGLRARHERAGAGVPAVGLRDPLRDGVHVGGADRGDGYSGAGGRVPDPVIRAPAK